MGKGLLAFWHRRIVSRGLAGAALFAIPVAVAAAIGFGTSLSGVAGGLTAVTSGPDALPASAQTTSSGLNSAVEALADRPTRAAVPNSGAGDDSSGGATAPGDGVSVGDGTDTDSGSGTVGSGTGTVADLPPTDAITDTPGVSPPDTSGVTDTTTNTVNQVGGTVDNLRDGVGQTLNGLLGGGR